MILVNKVEDRKAVIALFNVAHEFLQGKGWVCKAEVCVSERESLCVCVCARVFVWVFK
jgi:hypothetical protein